MITYYWNINKSKEMTLEEIKRDNPNVSIPENSNIEFIGYYKIIETEQPSYDELREGLQYDIIENNDLGVKSFMRVWKVYPLPEEDATVNIRQSEEILKKTYETKAQQRLDTIANQYGYDSILTACSYLNSTNDQFSSEARAFIKLRDDTWVKMIMILNEVKNGTRNKPESFSEIESELPELIIE